MQTVQCTIFSGSKALPALIHHDEQVVVVAGAGVPTVGITKADADRNKSPWLPNAETEWKELKAAIRDLEEHGRGSLYWNGEYAVFVRVGPMPCMCEDYNMETGLLIQYVEEELGGTVNKVNWNS